MKCTKCKSKLEKNMNFCPYCGLKIEKHSFFKTLFKLDTPKTDTLGNQSTSFWDKLTLYEKTTTIIIIIMAILLIALSTALYFKPSEIKSESNYNNSTEIKWSDIILNDIIPKPEVLTWEIISNSKESLILNVNNFTFQSYTNYIDNCKKKEFEIEMNQSSNSFTAYNTDGYKLSLKYNENKKEMNINLVTPETFSTLEWPDNEYTKIIPAPESNTGKIEKNDKSGFEALVNKVPTDAFKAYVASCINKGFNIDISESSKDFFAKNPDGYKLKIEYIGNSIIKISVHEPEYLVKFNVKCIENLIFSKYDVTVYINGINKGTLKHGTEETYSASLTKGDYTIKFINAKDNTIYGQTTISVSKAETMQFKLYCTSTKINIDILESKDSEPAKEENAESANQTEQEPTNVQNLAPAMESITPGFTDSTSTKNPKSIQEPNTTTATESTPASTAPAEPISTPATTKSTKSSNSSSTSTKTDSVSMHYILNTNTMKFHYPSCGSAKKIKDYNKMDFNGSRDELIKQGYSPCGNCKP